MSNEFFKATSCRGSHGTKLRIVMAGAGTEEVVNFVDSETADIN